MEVDTTHILRGRHVRHHSVIGLHYLTCLVFIAYKQITLRDLRIMFKA
jgi:hypothetical protein